MGLYNSFNSHLKGKSATREAAAREDMIILFLSAYGEEEKEVVLEFVSIASVASVKSDSLMNKVPGKLLNNNIDIQRFTKEDS